MLGESFPIVRTAVPGPASRAAVDRLSRTECPAITARRARRAAAIGAADTDPIVWDQAVGANVVDLDGNVYVDLTSGFGVATVGHRHPAVVAAGQAQLARLPHAMGDAFPDRARIDLLDALTARVGFERAILGLSGSDAVDAAIKTARLATGRHRVLSFTGGYHGLAAAPLAALGYHVAAFKEPFAPLLGQHTSLAPYGGDWPDLTDFAAVLVEPLQGRGGMRAPPDGWLARLHAGARAHGALVIHDEIFSGLGRTGAWLATDLRPDILCLGKSLGGGSPLSACLADTAVMNAWGASTGEAIHTQTFLGHPVGCAMALAALTVVETEGLVERARVEGARWAAALARFGPVTGRGFMLGLHVPDTLRLSRQLLERGWIVLPAGERAECLGLTPPLSTGRPLLDGFVDTLAELRG